jgi:hypothetical protein
MTVRPHPKDGSHNPFVLPCRLSKLKLLRRQLHQEIPPLLTEDIVGITVQHPLARLVPVTQHSFMVPSRN